MAEVITAQQFVQCRLLDSNRDGNSLVLHTDKELLQRFLGVCLHYANSSVLKVIANFSAQQIQQLSEIIKLTVYIYRTVSLS